MDADTINHNGDAGIFAVLIIMACVFMAGVLISHGSEIVETDKIERTPLDMTCTATGCGGRLYLDFWLPNGWAVECKCGCRGPFRQQKADAISAWTESRGG